MPSGLTFDVTSILRNLAEAQERAMLAVEALADTGSKKMESYAKINARWQNRTGHARQRLQGSYAPYGNGFRLKIAHGVDYGKWLELAHEKNYSIIPETIQKVGEEEIMPSLSNLLERLR